MPAFEKRLEDKLTYTVELDQVKNVEFLSKPVSCFRVHAVLFNCIRIFAETTAETLPKVHKEEVAITVFKWLSATYQV